MNPYIQNMLMNQQHTGMPADTTHPAMRQGSATPQQQPNTQPAKDMGYNPPPMGMKRPNPALAKSVQGVEEAKQQSARAQARAQGISPIDQGAMAAIGATKQMMQMDQQQRQAAFGQALMAFGSNLASSKNTSNLGAINESFAPAMVAWRGAQKNFEDTNNTAVKRYDEIEKDKLKREFDWDKLEFDKRYHMADLGIKQSEHERKVIADANRKFKDESENNQYKKDREERIINDSLGKLQERRDKMIQSRIKNTKIKGIPLETYMDGPVKDAKIAEITAAVDKQLSPIIHNIETKMKKHGLETSTTQAETDQVVVDNMTPEDKALVNDFLLKHPEYAKEDMLTLLEVAKEMQGK